MSLRRWLFTLLACGVLVGSLGAYKGLQISKAITFAESFPEHSETVDVVVAQHKNWQPTVKASGEVIALRSIELRNELEGKIVELGFSAGQVVNQGQLLLKLDTREEQARLDAANAQTELAKLAMKRYQKLLKQNASSRDRYDQARSELVVAKANAESLQAIIEKKTLRAPFDAFTGLHQLDVGQYISANTLITDLVGVDQRVWVDFNLPQQQAGVSLNTPIQIVSAGLLQQPMPGVVIARDAAVMVQSRNLRFRAELQDTERRLKPGALVEVNVPIGDSQAAIILPATAIRRDNFGAYIYRIDKKIDEQGNKTQRAKKQSIIIGPNQGDRAVVLDGVEKGDIVATNGAYKLRDGMLVNVQKQQQIRQGDQP